MTALCAFGLLAGALAAIGAWSEGLYDWHPWQLYALAGAGLLLSLLRRGRPLGTACIGALLAACALADYQRHRLPASCDERVLVRALIEGIPQRRGAALQFTALLSPLRAGTVLLPGTRASLRWEQSPALEPGEAWQLLVTLHAPPAAANPGSMDEALQSLRLRLHASGQVIASPLDARLLPAAASLDRLRGRLAHWMAAQLPERDSAALLVALAVGDTQRVSPEQWRVFNAVGITHLVAISGLHVTGFSLVAGWLAAQSWRRSPRLQRRVVRASFAAAVGVLAAAGYALLSGWSVPAQRTLVMLACWHGLQALARRRDAATTLAAGLAGVLLLDPLAPLAAGFWLSFLAVGSLLLAGALAPVGNARGRGWAPAVRTLLAEQAWVGAALLPVTVAVFGSVSLAGLGVNLLAIPFFSLLLVPLVLASTALALAWPALAVAPLRLAAWLAQQAWPLLEAAANLPHALWRVQPAAWWYGLAAAGLAVLLLPWRGWMRASAALALLPLAWPQRAALQPGEFAATVFDAGGGEAILLRTGHHALLYGDGEVHGSEGRTTARVIVPALRHYGLTQLDRVLLPRVDADQGAGVAALDAALEAPPALWAGTGAAGGAGNARGVVGEGLPPEFTACQPGTGWSWDGVAFDWLAGSGCALRVSSGVAALLLTGAERAAALAGSIAPALAPAPLVLVPGKAARSAHSPAFVATAQAQVAFVATTARAATQGSASATIAAWCASGARVLVTGLTGAIEFVARPDGEIRIAMPRRAQVSCATGSRPE
jgi:competence protein ComEC